MSTVYQLTFNQVYLGRDMANVSYWETVTDTATVQELADEIGLTFAASGVLNHYSDDWQFTSISFRALDGTPPFSLDVVPAGFPLVGVSLEDPLPASTCMLISLFHQGPRPNRGRQYLPGLTENAIENGLFTDGVRVTFRDLYLDWRNGITVGGDEFSLRIVRPDFATNTALFSHSVDLSRARQNPATQRRRRLGSE